MIRNAWLIMMFLSFSAQAARQINSLHFLHLDIDDRLSDTYIKDIQQDNDGFIWIATQDGLNRFDGHEVVSYKNKAREKAILSSNYVTELSLDKENNLWLATADGISRLDLATYQFQQIPIIRQGKEVSAYVNMIYLSGSGKVWAASSDGLYYFSQDKFVPFDIDGLDKQTNREEVVAITEDSTGLLLLSREEKSVLRINPDNHQTDSLNAVFPTTRLINDVTAFARDKVGNVWMANNSGELNKIDLNGSKLDYFHLPKVKQNIRVSALTFDDKGNLWIATKGQGIFIYDPISKEFSRHFKSDHFHKSLVYDFIEDIFIAPDSLVWVATTKGVDVHNPHSKSFTHYYTDPANPNAIRNNTVWSIYKSDKQDIWVSHDEGIDILNSKGEKIHSLLNDANNLNSLSIDRVSHVSQWHDGTYWIATEKGLNRYDPKNKSYRHYFHQENNVNSLPSSNVYLLYQDKKNQLWIGTTKGLARYREATDDFERIESIVRAPVYSVAESGDGILWVGTSRQGLFRLDTKTLKSEHWVHDSNNPNSLSSNRCFSLAFDGHQLWVGTDIGVNAIDLSNGKIKRFGITDGLPGEKVYRIEIDNTGNIWMSTTQGLARMIKETHQIQSFNDKDGIQAQDFNVLSSYYDSKSDTLYFGGINGVTAFSPAVVSQLRQNIKLRASNFYLFNTPVTPGVDQLLNAPIHRQDIIHLTYDQNVFAFQLSGLDMLNGDKLTYAYRLNGLEERWLNTVKLPLATYTNVPPGSYQLSVKARYGDGPWSDEQLLTQIEVSAPLWATWWAYTLYIVVIISLIAIFAYQRQKIALATEKRKMAESANEAKSNFLATMSHEIRTPINGVIGAVSLLNECHLNEEQESYANTIKVSGENLLYVVNDILDLSKIEAGRFDLEYHRFNLRDCIENALDLFTIELDKNHLELVLIADDTVPLEVISDSTRLRQIVVNLVGNAIKFTEYGNVSVILNCNEILNDQVSILFTIKDTGEGIPQEKQQHIFDAFKQADDSISRTHGGTGLGLTICQRLVTILGGQIGIDSQPGQGTEFHFTLKMKYPTSSAGINEISSLIPTRQSRLLFVGCDECQIRLFESLQQTLQAELVHVRDIPHALDYLSHEDPPDAMIINQHFSTPIKELFLGEVRRLTQTYHFPLALLVTPNTAHEHAQALQPLFDRIILKPLKLRNVAKNIAQLMRINFKEKESDPNQLGEEFAIDSPLSILLAEDNAVNQKMLLYTFRKLGYAPDIVSNGDELIKAVKLKHYDIVLTDYQMPQTTGIEAAQKIRNYYKPDELAIILISADVTSDFDSLIQAEVIQDTLSKPIKIDALKQCLTKWSQNLTQLG